MRSTLCIWIMVLLLNCVFCDGVSTPSSRELLTSNENSNRILSEAAPSPPPGLPPPSPAPPIPEDYHYVDDSRFTVYYDNRQNNVDVVSCTQICANTVYGNCDDSVQPNNVNTEQKMRDLVSSIRSFDRTTCDTVAVENSTLAPYVDFRVANFGYDDNPTGIENCRYSTE